MAFIFSPPVDSQRAAPGLQSNYTKRKRRAEVTDYAEQGRDGQDADSSDALHDTYRKTIDIEYTAVISPLERLQRRTAGQPLDQPPPVPPFPHAGLPSRKTGSKCSSQSFSEGSQSLHMQHLAALTAIVHRTLLQGDFPRASRAIGLLFREDAINHGTAARSNGLMGIAAEVLLRQGFPRRPGPGLEEAEFPFTPEGFEKAKRFYERLIIRHPYHKSWPGSVNAIDFYLALFTIWIYVVHAENASDLPLDAEEESLAGSTWARSSSSSSPRLERQYSRSHAKVRELAQANEIASRMDTCMASVPFVDEPELIRLRAMVALWTADLYEHTGPVVLPAAGDQTDTPSLDEESALVDHAREAVQARDRARVLLSRLKAESEARDDQPE